MSARRDALELLLNFSAPITELRRDLLVHPWDSDQKLAILTRAHAVSVRQRYCSGALSGDDLEQWADAIECRDDVGFEQGRERVLMDLVFSLPNPYLTRGLTAEVAEERIAALQSPFTDEAEA